MSGKHWDDDDLIGHLYGVGPGDGHLEECAECGKRWQALLGRRGSVLAQPDLPEEFLAQQRLEIRQRISRNDRSRWWLALAPAAVTAAVLLIAVFLYRPAPAPPPTPSITSADRELYTEVYSMAQANEPQAAEPIQALFEEEQ